MSAHLEQVSSGSLSLNVNGSTSTETLVSSRSSRLHANHRINLYSIKKCWVCLAGLEFEDNEFSIIQQYFIDQNLLYINSGNGEIGSEPVPQSPNKNLIKLKLFMNKFILSVCKCRRKLAHKKCFSNYIDLKQNGNINVDILCSQCNYKYEFDYPYNSKYFHLFLDHYVWWN